MIAPGQLTLRLASANLAGFIMSDIQVRIPLRQNGPMRAEPVAIASPDLVGIGMGPSNLSLASLEARRSDAN